LRARTVPRAPVVDFSEPVATYRIALLEIDMNVSSFSPSPTPSFQTSPVPQSPAAAGTGASGDLKRGDRGAGVETVQRQLAELGLTKETSGVFSAQTEQAVKRFQSEHKLKSTGVVDAATKKKLQAAHELLAGPPAGASNKQKLDWAMRCAKEMGLKITATTNGKHAKHSYHYQGRAVDVAGAADRMAAFYDAMHRQRPTELFYDPKGGVKHGKDIKPIGGHGTHVHVAF
jgi:peptidoglycan hydrolase-like protein with peptidoglycan-binding domain